MTKGEVHPVPMTPNFLVSVGVMKQKLRSQFADNF